jgi:hypothetical protein
MIGEQRSPPAFAFAWGLTTLKLKERAHSDKVAWAKIFILHCPNCPETRAFQDE